MVPRLTAAHASSPPPSPPLVMPTLDGVTLVRYLNGHLGVSEAALQLMSRISREFDDAELSELMRHLSREVREEQAVVRVLIGAAGGRDAARRHSMGWGHGRGARLRAWGDRGNSEGVRLLEALESLSASFSRRHALWLALAALPRELLPSAMLDCSAFADRVREQLDSLEPWRLRCAAAALVRQAPAEPEGRWALPSPGQGRATTALRSAGAASLP